MKPLHVAVVILNYNTEKDLMVCAEDISKQTGIHLSIIIVDNASQSESVKRIKSWLLSWQPNTICRTPNSLIEWAKDGVKGETNAGKVFFIENSENRGYSAGNNIGIRLAKKLGADAVLIVNPDVRIEDTSYLAKLSKQLFANSKNYVAASRILGLDGKDQNPLREAAFWEEVLWPRQLLRKFFKSMSYIIPLESDKPISVSKVSGCCLMIKMSFLKTIGFLDENVFLYCEEPILSAQVKREGGRIIYAPRISAIHAHKKSEKGNSSKRMLFFIKSRKYYLNKYSGYQKWQLIVLSFSYLLLRQYYKIKVNIK